MKSGQQRWRPRWKAWLRDIGICFAVLLAVEQWRSRDMAKGLLPETMRTTLLVTLDGSKQSTWQEDRYTLLYIFAPWCGVCRYTAGGIHKLVSSDLTVKALALSWEHESDVTRFVQETGLQAPVLLGSDSASEALQVSAFPSYFLINRNGRILASWSGYTSRPGLYLRSIWVRLMDKP